jgi:four helix bundle protein
MDLAVEVYHLARTLPDAERFGLASQLQRAATSIPSNLAEGHERRSRGDFRRHVSMARGSVAEIETQLELGRRVGLLAEDASRSVELLAAEVGRMLSTLLRRLKT